MPAYVVYHHERPVSREYPTWAEAELFLLFETPGTPHYRVRVVSAPDTPTEDADHAP